jgi:hypothetical protein
LTTAEGWLERNRGMFGAIDRAGATLGATEPKISIARVTDWPFAHIGA